MGFILCSEPNELRSRSESGGLGACWRLNGLGARWRLNGLSSRLRLNSPLHDACHGWQFTRMTIEIENGTEGEALWTELLE